MIFLVIRCKPLQFSVHISFLKEKVLVSSENILFLIPLLPSYKKST